MRFINILLLTILVNFSPLVWATHVRYALDVQVDTQNQHLVGVAHITAAENQALAFSVKHLSNLIVADKPVTATNGRMTLEVQGGQALVIRYQAALNDDSVHFVDQDNVFLTGGWYPEPDALVEYALSVTLPTGFLATSEAETVAVRETETTSTFTFEFNHPLDSLNLAASKNYVLTTDTYQNIALAAYFFKEDAHLAETYLEHSKKYLAMYEQMLTPYPYQRFAIVENILPTGFGMPTYTLLGRAVVRLPFIVKTSLGHEVLHEWFGNSVFIDDDSGNWAEGLTNYLADLHYATLEGKGVAYRKQIMVDYNAYVNDNNAMPVKAFQFRRNKAQRAIGYGKTALIFHQLRTQYGDEVFFAALRGLISTHSFRRAAWRDVQQAFEKVTGDNLAAYFTQWLERKDIPHITVEDVALRVAQGQLTLSFTVVQHTAATSESGIEAKAADVPPKGPNPHTGRDSHVRGHDESLPPKGANPDTESTENAPPKGPNPHAGMDSHVRGHDESLPPKGAAPHTGMDSHVRGPDKSLPPKGAASHTGMDSHVRGNDEQHYLLQLPVTIHTASGKTQRLVEVSGDRNKITLVLDEVPTKVVIDEDYDVMRQLLPEEIPPTLAGIMGKEKMRVVMSPEQHDLYQPLINALGITNMTLIAPQALTFTQVKENSLMIAGFDTPMVDMLFGKQTVPDDGVRVVVHKNPYNEAEMITLLHANNANEVKAVARRLSHYGKYSVLAFTGGRNTQKAITESTNGIPLFTRPATHALKPSQVATLADIIPTLVDSRVIYVGEQHDQFAHHLNQLKVIKKLHEAGYKIAVGMEMFQVPYQKALDDYIAGRIDEMAFLRASRYFSTWQFDYNLYKPIIDYVKTAGIPLIALNIDKHITQKVAREGIHSLTDEEKQHLPAEMDFANATYRQDLYQVFLQHQPHFGQPQFEYFLQSQALWDETMAQTAHQFLTENPKTQLIVLAGNGHLRYRYGIPNRVYRRGGEPFTVIVQDDTLVDGIGDYVLLTEEIQGQQSPKLGVWIDDKANQVVIKNVSDNTPAKQAGLQAGDRITQLAGHNIQALVDLKWALFYTDIGSTVTIQVIREGETITQDITFSTSD